MKIVFYRIFLIVALVTTGCSRQNNEHYQGYIEGQYTYISANATGILKQLFVAKGHWVNQQDVLFILEQRPESDLLQEAKERVSQAVAQLAGAQANTRLSKLTLQRSEDLFKRKAIDEASLDAARTNVATNDAALRNAQANLLAAKALFNRAQWTSEQKTIVSPKRALVFDTYYRTGELIAIAQPVLALLSPTDIKVVFFIPEEKLNQIKIGSAITLTCNTCRRSFHSKITFISPTVEYTPPIIYSTETTSKFIFRVEGPIASQDTDILHPGQPVKVTISHER